MQLPPATVVRRGRGAELDKVLLKEEDVRRFAARLRRERFEGGFGQGRRK